MTATVGATLRSATRESALDDRSAGASDEIAREPPNTAPDRLGRLGWTVIAGGVLCAAGGLVVVIAWYANALSILRANAQSTPIAFNSGVAFVLIGLALVATVLRRNRLVLLGASVAALFGTITLLEHALGRGLGIDQLLFRTSVAGPSGLAGRMATTTASCFLVVSAALLWRVLGPARGRALATGGAGGLVLAVAAVAAASYASGQAQAYQWGRLAPMALPTAVLFILVGTSLLAVTWHDPPRSVGDDLRTGVDRSRHPRQQQWSVRRVVAGLAVLAYVPLGLLAYLSVTWSSEAVNREAGTSAQTAAALEAQALLLRIEALRTLAASIAARPAIVAALTNTAAGSIDVSPLQALLDDARAAAPEVASLGITDPDGRLLSLSPVTPDTVGHDFSFRDWYKGVTRTGDAYVSDAVQSAAEGHPLVVTIASPLRSRPGGPVVGYLSLEYLLTSFQEFARGFRAAQQVSLTITDQRGVAVASLNQPDGLVSLTADEPVRLALAGISGVRSRNGPDGRQWVGYSPVGDIGWTVTATFSATPALDRIAQLRTAVVAIALILAAAVTVALVLVARGWRARTAAERELDRLVTELDRSNDELQQFAYAASHDLSEPLRAISGPISLMARRYHDQLDAEADQLIDFAVDGCQRMQQIIDGLLAYSRVGRLESAFRPTDCNLIMNGVMAALGPAIEEAGATVHVGTLPTVKAETNQLGLVLQNLISNALKFVRPGVAPIVSVQADRIDSEWRYSVTDNGIGIAPQHRDRIFGMFKRLHSREQYPGTGIGLALVKKIVERHGGRIGVEDGPDGTGSRFWFTLPAERG
jgi:signal transduction histidine kinase